MRALKPIPVALDFLRAFFDEEGFGPGARLPSERQLAKRIGCSRSVLRGSLAVLQGEGLIRRHVGQGTFYRGDPPSTRIIPRSISAADLMNARLLIEPEVAAAAAMVGTRSQADRLRYRISECRRSRDHLESECRDRSFHTELAVITGNSALIGCLQYFEEARRQQSWQRFWRAAYTSVGIDTFRKRHCDHHEAIVRAVAGGQPIVAENAMRAHLNDVRTIGLAFGLEGHERRPKAIGERAHSQPELSP